MVPGLTIAVVLGLGLSACTGDKGPGGSTPDDTAAVGSEGGGSGTADGGGTAGAGTSSGGSGSGSSGDTGDNPMIASVGGGITLELVKTGVDGLLEPASFEDVFGEDFPFGRIWVGAYQETMEGAQDYRGTATIREPVGGTNPYEISLVVPTETQVFIYAVLDENRDQIIAPSDPMGVYPNPVLVYEGVGVTSVDIDILINVDAYIEAAEKGEGGEEPATEGTIPLDEHGNPCETTNISGAGLVDSPYVHGDAAVFLTDAAGQGPVQSLVSWFPLVARGSNPGDGATGNYVMQGCKGAEDVSLLGVHDRDDNGLGDPADIWGAHITQAGQAGNPISVESTAKTDMTVQIPLGESAGGEAGGGGLGLVPFVHLAGTLSTWGGGFSGLPSGSTVLVTALKYRPNRSASYDTLEANSYDIELWEWSEIEDADLLDWKLTVPASTIVYLWAYADEDGDLIFNESGEHVDGGGEDSNGTVVTGTSSTTGFDMQLGLASG